MKDVQNRVHTCSVRARLIRDTQGTPSRIIGIFRDITEQKAMADKKRDLKDQLNRSKKMEALGLLARGVAHDLNNVLSGLVTYPELLLSDLPPDDPMRESLGVILSSGRRATRIVQDLLTLSRRGVTSREVINLNTMVTRFMQTPEYRNILAQSRPDRHF